jgi:hypothetical protein
MSGNSNMDYYANKGYVLVYPDGLPFVDGKLGWRTLATPQYNTGLDQNFVELMIAELTSSPYNCDASKIYCSGFSNGTDVCWQMYTQRSDLIRGFSTFGRGIDQEFVGLTPAILRPWSTTIGQQDDSWDGHKDPPENNAWGALETRDYVCGLNNRTTVATPPAGTAAGSPPNPSTGTKLTVFNYNTVATSGQPSAQVSAGTVSQVTQPALHRWFAKLPAWPDNFYATSYTITFFKTYAGLPAEL